ncbi:MULTISPECIES: alginate O-acetyltransferase AlgF [unclassified Shimia]|uniref:alginate O-acetyltransferase AlgF n=1 Tax=unclassified Shimia TaxID=2630038 RepID=UPI003105CFD2
MDRFLIAPIVALVPMCLAQAGVAADNELYDTPPPDDAAFIRWIEDDVAPEILGVRSLGKEGDVFHPVSAALSDGARAGAYYTAAVDASGHVVLIEEPARSDKSKVLVTLVNLSDASVRLVLTEQNVDVIGTTEKNQSGGRAVNPAAATLSVVAGQGDVLGTFDVQLRRGQNVTFVARPEQVELIENRFGSNLEG